jgi:phosphomannomutase
MKIKFGTDGWRAIIARDFTEANVARAAEGTALWIKKNFKDPSIVIGHDCRFAGEMFAHVTANVMAAHNIQVFIANKFVSTPMISFGAKTYGASVGVIITASHNPPSYNGYKLKSHHGGPLSPEKVQEVEDLIPDNCSVKYTDNDFDNNVKAGKIKIVALEDDYVKHIEKSFDLDAIKKSGIKLAYDAMYGAGQNVMKRILPDMLFLHCEYNPSFMGQAPEPIHKNLIEFSNLLKSKGNIECGIATDGDADRIGLYNSRGEFIDSHHIILLLIHYLVKYKKQTGKVVTAFSTTPRIAKICKHYNLELETVKIGFKYIAGIMVEQDVLVGGEESGGIAIKGHIPERDGIWMGLVIAEFLAKSGKKLDDLIAEVYEITGSFAFERNDLHIDEAVKQNIIKACQNKTYDHFGSYKVDRIEDLDGYKYFLGNDEWIMIRPSGTEPVLRLYAESSTQKGAFKILEETKKQILA